MYRLIEITFANDKEVQAIYPYEDRTIVEGEFESKLGQAMLNKADELLVAIDDSSEVLINSEGQTLVGKVGTHEFSPRLYECKTTDEIVADISKYDDVETLIARFHTKKGAAIKNSAVKQEVLYGFNGNGMQIIKCCWVRPIEPVEPQAQGE